MAQNNEQENGTPSSPCAREDGTSSSPCARGGNEGRDRTQKTWVGR